MKRIIHEVNRWSIFLHREARGLPPVETEDPVERRFEDELFEKLFAGGVEALDEKDRDPKLAAWAEKVHAACDQLPDFTRLAGECRGDAMAAGIGVETLVDALRPYIKVVNLNLRPVVRACCERASAAIDEMRELIEGLEQVSIGRAPGTGTVQGESRPNAMTRSLAVRIKNDARLRRIALLAGKFKRIAATKRRQKIKHGADELSDIEAGADVGRLLPSELVRLVHPRLKLAMLRDLTERRCLQYALSGNEALGKGPLVVCLDKSGSMDGQPDIWSTAVALALLDVAQREHRAFCLLGFDEQIKQEVVVMQGGAIPEAELFLSCSGGTDIANVIEKGLDVIEQHPGAMMKMADIVLITDGGSAIDRAAELRARAAALGVTILGFGIGVEPASLMPWCDEAHAVVDLDRLDDRSAESLFAR